MATKSQPQLEWRFWDEEGTDDTWMVERTVVADPPPADQANVSGRRWPNEWRLALLLIAVTVLYLWGRPWSSREGTTLDNHHIEPTTQTTSRGKDTGPSPVPVTLAGRDEMNPIEQHCSQLPPDLAPASCHPPLVDRPAVVGAPQLDPAKQPCSPQSPTTTAPAEVTSDALLQYWNIAY